MLAHARKPRSDEGRKGQADPQGAFSQSMELLTGGYMDKMKKVAKKEVKAHEKTMHGMKCGGKVKKYASGGAVRGTGCATKGKNFSGVF